MGKRERQWVRELLSYFIFLPPRQKLEMAECILDMPTEIAFLHAGRLLVTDCLLTAFAYGFATRLVDWGLSEFTEGAGWTIFWALVLASGFYVHWRWCVGVLRRHAAG